VALSESIENAYRFLKKKREQSTWKQKKVVHFVPYFPPHSGGLEMYAKEWAENYAKMWWEIIVATFSWWQKTKNRNQDGYEVVVLPAFDIIHNFPFPKFWLPSFWKGLSKIKRFNSDIVHTHTRFFLSTLLGGLFSKYYKIPWIHIEHGSGFVVTNKKFVSKMSRIYDMSIWKWCLSHADSIIAVSEACEHFVRDTFSVKNVRTIYRWIDQNFGKPNRDHTSIHIGYIGRLVDLKWVDILIEAFARVFKENPSKHPLKLKIVGDGPERKNLEKQVESLHLGDHVEFLGSQSFQFVRGEFLPSLHIFVNPSLQEWLPTTVIEALAAQCRVVATDVGGTREILRYASFALVAPKSVRALTDGIIQEIKILSTLPSRPLPVSLFSWEQTFREVRELYSNY
jgi:glycosyltransferase involved in cell wall biosynthesis